MAEFNNLEEIENKFHKACDTLASLVKLKTLDKSILLKFYGLFKQGTIGKCNIDKPSWYNMEAKSKFNAWNELGDMSKTDAMVKYIDLLTEISPEWVTENDNEEEIDWDSESVNKGEKSDTKGWVNVSTMQNNEAKLDENEKNVYEWVKDGDLSMLKWYLDKNKNFNIDSLDSNGLNCLHWACDRGHTDVVKYLVETCKANIHAKDIDGETCLDYAKIVEKNELVTYLIQHGAE